jgi:hypothetical protein
VPDRLLPIPTTLIAGFPIGRYLRLSALALLCVTAACAEMRWQRSGADEATRDADLEVCRQQARAQSARLAWPFPGDRSRMAAFDRAGRPVTTPYPFPTWLDTDRSVLEFELIGDCMRSKGYALTPAEQNVQP